MIAGHAAPGSILSDTGPPPKGRWRRALTFTFPHRRAVVAISLFALVLAALSAVEPLVLKWIFDGLEKEREVKRLLIGVGVLLGIAALKEVISGVSNWLTWHTRLGIHFALLEQTVGRLHRMPLRMQRSEGVGAIMTRLDRGIQGFIGAVTQLLFNVFPAVVYLLISVAIMLRLDWRLALIVLAFAPVPAITAAFATPEQTRRERTLLDRWARIYSRFNEVLSGIVTVRSFAMEDMEKQRFLRDVAAANAVVVTGVRTDSTFAAATNLAIALARVTTIGAGGVLILRGEITLGTLVALLGYVGGLFGPVQGLTGIYQTLEKAKVALDEVFGILDVQEHLGDAPDATELTQVHGDVEFENVTFHYEQADRPLLNRVTLNVRAGEVVAIVGPSGSGKTTMMALLMRFYDPITGAIRIDGRDLRSLKQSSVRRSIGVVLQDPLLFNDTISNNIAYGRPDAKQADIEAAAKAANAHDFIMRMPDKYETGVGERGNRLSVGERQRVTIARALIKNPRIIVLDEATSSLDAESEALVQSAIERLMKGRTTFVIAHRLATVVNADRIIVLKEGQISESGSHAELMRLEGYYASLVKQQTKGLIQNVGEPLEP
jgi:ATP-binding cassette, subfamily B, bacterial